MLAMGDDTLVIGVATPPNPADVATSTSSISHPPCTKPIGCEGGFTLSGSIACQVGRDHHRQ